jgi:hypothetical protein
MRFHDPNTAIFSCAEAKALAAFASTDADGHKALHSVCIDFARGAAVATDGHRLVKSNGAQSFAGAAQLLVPLPPWQQALKACAGKKKSGVLVRRDAHDVALLAIDAGPYDLMSLGGSGDCARLTIATILTEPVVDHTFPDYEQVIPELAPDRAIAHRFGLNPCYLADLHLVAKAAGRSFIEVLPPPDEYSPLVVRAQGYDGSWLVLIMPTRL